METEVWVRNPHLCIKECLEVGLSTIVWDRGYLVKRNIDPTKFMSLYYGTRPYRMLVVGTPDQGTLELDQTHTMGRPLRVHPTWEFGQPIQRLEELMEAAQPNQLLVITNLPDMRLGMSKALLRTISQMQEDYPNATVHVHGLYSFPTMFGLQFKSVDVEPREGARCGKVTLPNGKEMTYERASESPQWITLLGMRPSDLKVPRNRCMYNIKSAQWAGKHFKDALSFEHRNRTGVVDPDDPSPKPVVSRTIFLKRKQEVRAGDKFLCDVCSLQLSCKYFREGAVCIVPDSEPQELARFFKTRDSDTIIDGLGTLLAAQTRRLQSGLLDEAAEGELDPEVTKIINTLFDRGVKLAKLVNPALAAAGAARITVNQNTLTASTPQALMAAIVQEFVDRGIPRDQITPEMVRAVIDQDEAKQKAIEVASMPRGA